MLFLLVAIALLGLIIYVSARLSPVSERLGVTYAPGSKNGYLLSAKTASHVSVVLERRSSSVPVSEATLEDLFDRSTFRPEVEEAFRSNAVLRAALVEFAQQCPRAKEVRLSKEKLTVGCAHALSNRKASIELHRTNVVMLAEVLSEQLAFLAPDTQEESQLVKKANWAACAPFALLLTGSFLFRWLQPDPIIDELSPIWYVVFFMVLFALGTLSVRAMTPDKLSRRPGLRTALAVAGLLTLTSGYSAGSLLNEMVAHSPERHKAAFKSITEEYRVKRAPVYTLTVERYDWPYPADIRITRQRYQDLKKLNPSQGEPLVITTESGLLGGHYVTNITPEK